MCALSVCLLCLLPVAASAGTSQTGSTGSTGQSGTGVPTSGDTATLEECLTTGSESERAATFSGQMVAISTTGRMLMRIDVQEKLPGDFAFHTLNAPGLGVWRRSASGVKVYKYLKQVTNLAAPASFRALVRFRWVNERGHVVRHAERRTPICEQPDPRAKLTVAQIRVLSKRGSPQAGYQIVMRNEGHTLAGAFDASLIVNGIAQPLLQVPSLAAGGRTVLETQAPRCVAGSEVEVQLDPTHQIEEAAGGGMAGSVACPLVENG